jgi:hypothetical protein
MRNPNINYTTGTNMNNPLMNRTNIQYEATTVEDFNANYFYEPIPYDFLYLPNLNPAINVQVNGVEAICATSDMDCSYEYIEPTALITSYDLQGTLLTIGGTNLPTSNIRLITFANNVCNVVSATTTQIVCSLPSTTAGDWRPVVIDSFGQVPLDPSLTVVEVPVTITSVYPTTALNPQGDNIITITGTNFPVSTDDGSTIEITLSDGTQCVVLSSTTTEIKCRTQSFSQTAFSVTGTVTINSKTDSSLSLTITTAPATVRQLIPTLVSPVLKADITITVDQSFAGTLDREDLEIFIEDIANPANVRQVNVISVDNTAKTILVKYGGAYTGEYKLIVRSISLGRFDTGDVTLYVQGKILDFSPRQGSIYGGTLITITGYNFSSDPLDNNVRIGITDCIVETSENGQITCRTLEKAVTASNIDENVEELVVLLKVSEEAKCETSLGHCNYTWLDDSALPSLTSYSLEYDSSLDDYVVVLTGTGFPTSTSSVIFKIDGFTQTILSASATEIKVQVTEMLSSHSTNIQFYLPEGSPSGMETLLEEGITLNPLMLSVSPGIGSPAGSIITAIVKGVDPLATVLTLITSTGTDICEKVEIPVYGTIKCKTKAMTIASNNLQFKVDSFTYSCANSGTCSYQTSTSMPTVSSLSILSNGNFDTMIISGSNFFTSDFTAKVSFSGVEAIDVNIDSDS